MKWSRPFEPTGRVIWVGGRVSGLEEGDKRDLHMVFDTGTATAIIDEQIATAVGMHRGHKTASIRFWGADGVHDGYLVKVPAFEAFGREVKDLTVACCPLPVDLGVDGLLGLDFVRYLEVTLNFKTGLITLED